MDKTYTAVSRISHKLNAYRDKPRIRELVLLSMALYPHAEEAGEFKEAFKSLKKKNDEFGYLQSNAEKVLKHFNNDDIEAVFSLIKSIFDEKVVKYYTFETLRRKFSNGHEHRVGFYAGFILDVLKDMHIENKTDISDISGEGIFMRAVADMLRKQNNEKPLLIIYSRDDSAKLEILCNMAMNNYNHFRITAKPEYNTSLLLDIPFLRIRRPRIRPKERQVYLKHLDNAQEAIIADAYHILTSIRDKSMRETLINNNRLKSVITVSSGCLYNTMFDLGIMHIGHNDSNKIDMKYYEKSPHSLKKLNWRVNKNKIEKRDYNLHYRGYKKVTIEEPMEIDAILDEINSNLQGIDRFIKSEYEHIKKV